MTEIISVDAQSVSGAGFGQGTGPVLLDQVACSGSETSLLDCTSVSSAISCPHSQDAGVRCNAIRKDDKIMLRPVHYVLLLMQLFVKMELSGLSMDLLEETTVAALRSASRKCGDPFVMTIGHRLMPMLLADSLDSQDLVSQH